MSAATGIWNPAPASNANPMISAKAMDTSGSSGSAADAADATISANDFLTLLVTEMQNQDPTSDTDPNEYIDQLVNVNSLEQLVNINQTLSSAFPTTSTTSSSSAAPAQTSATSTASTNAAAAHANSTSTQAATSAQAAITLPTNGTHRLPSDPMQPTGHPIPVESGGPVKFARGNLSAPSTSPSALRVARSLDGQRITR
jgi:flagellar basal-body rod modification protein FlgD